MDLFDVVTVVDEGQVCYIVHVADEEEGQVCYVGDAALRAAVRAYFSPENIADICDILCAEGGAPATLEAAPVARLLRAVLAHCCVRDHIGCGWSSVAIVAADRRVVTIVKP